MLRPLLRHAAFISMTSLTAASSSAQQLSTNPFPEPIQTSEGVIALSFADAHKQFIAEGGVFDTIYKPKK